MYKRTELAMKALHENKNSQKEMLIDIPLIRKPMETESQLPGLDLEIDNLLELNLSSKYNMLRACNEPQIAKLMITLKSKDVNVSKIRTGLDLVILIDTSSSMLRTKIELVQETLLFIIDELEEIDRLSIIKFNDESSILMPLVPMTPAYKAKMKLVVVSQLNCFGNTNIIKGLEDSFSVLLNRKEKNELTSIFLLSDGEDTAGNKQDAFQQFIGQKELEMGKRGMDFQISTFGFGIDHDEVLLSSLAEKKQGFFYYVKDLKRVDECFIDCLSKIMSVIAKNVEIDVFLNGGIKFAKKYGNFWKEGFFNVDGKGTLKILTIKAGSEMNFLTDVLVPPIVGEEPVKIGIAILNYLDKNRNSMISKELKLSVAKDAFLGEVNKKVEELEIKFSLCNVIEQVEEKLNNNLDEDAKKLINDFTNFLDLKKEENNAWVKETFQVASVGSICKSSKMRGQLRHAYANEQDDMPGVAEIKSSNQCNDRKAKMMCKRGK